MASQPRSLAIATVDVDEPVSLARLVTPLAAHLRAIVLVALLTALVVAAVTVLTPPKFEASLAFSTLQNSRLGGVGAGLPSSLLGAVSGSGLQPTPVLLDRLATSENVRVNVARAVVPGRRGKTVADLLRQGDTRSFADPKVALLVARVVSTTNDRETGLVTVSTRHPDSALARFITQRVVDEATAAFQVAMKSQATETRESLNERFDTAATRLNSAEAASQEFAAHNRTVAPYSTAALERDRLDRVLRLAQTLYDQVVTEREAARQRELENTPAVVVVEPLPRQLPVLSRGLATKTVIGFMLAALVGALFFSAYDLWASPRRPGESDGDRLVRTLRENSWLRWIVRHRAATPAVPGAPYG